MNLSEITSYIHEHIPLTSHLGAVVEAYDGKAIILSAPLTPNLNHRNTAFGGSISALGILSGWTLLFLKLKEAGMQINEIPESELERFRKVTYEKVYPTVIKNKDLGPYTKELIDMVIWAQD